MGKKKRFRLERDGLRLVSSHINRVQNLMADCSSNLVRRMANHDQSKFAPQELGLIVGKPALDKLEYMSPGYKEALESAKAAVSAHYAANPHHPEHYARAMCLGACWKTYHLEDVSRMCPTCGASLHMLDSDITEMSLLDLLEMACDWRAASEDQGISFESCVETNTERFQIPIALKKILLNTGRELGWISNQEPDSRAVPEVHITINGERHALAQRVTRLSHEDIVLLAYGKLAEAVCTISFSKRSGEDGTLAPRQETAVEDGMIINAFYTGNA